MLFGVLAGIAVGAFIALAHEHDAPAGGKARGAEGSGDVVLPPAMLPMMYLGDRFLAANVEFIRVTSSGRLADNESLDFFARLHDNVSSLNPCHEDNYYIASAFLPWGGATETALTVLKRAAHCRFWDSWAAFMLGFNQLFFFNDVGAAAAGMKEAARRSTGSEATFFSTLAVTVQASEYDDLAAALAYLREERSRAGDASLQAAIDRRIGRLEGLLVLRESQQIYERKYGRSLRHPQELLSSGVLADFPKDPLGVGYEFRGQRFELRQAVEIRRGK